LPGIHLSKPAGHPPIAAPLERCGAVRRRPGHQPRGSR